MLHVFRIECSTLQDGQQRKELHLVGTLPLPHLSFSMTVCFPTPSPAETNEMPNSSSKGAHLQLKNQADKTLECCWKDGWPVVLIGSEDSILGLCLMVQTDLDTISEDVLRPSNRGIIEISSATSSALNTFLYSHSFEGTSVEAAGPFSAPLAVKGNLVMTRGFHIRMEHLFYLRFVAEEQKLDLFPVARCIDTDCISTASMILDANTFLIAHDTFPPTVSLCARPSPPGIARPSDRQSDIVPVRVDEISETIAGMLTGRLGLITEPWKEAGPDADTHLILYSTSGSITRCTVKHQQSG